MHTFRKYRYVFCLKICIFSILVLSLISSCSSVRISNYKLPDLPPNYLINKKIAVLTFNGPGTTTGLIAGEWFAHNLSKYESLIVIPPGQVEIAVRDRGSEARLHYISNEEASKVALLIGADLVVLGEFGLITEVSDSLEVTGSTDIYHIKARCIVLFVDAITGEVIKEFTGDNISSANNRYLGYMRATNRAALHALGASTSE